MTIETNVPDEVEIGRVCMRFLARREYTRIELVRKLLPKSFHSDDINRVLAELEEKGYLSDERFADMFARSRVNNGFGPYKIKYELQEGDVACKTQFMPKISSVRVFLHHSCAHCCHVCIILCARFSPPTSAHCPRS